VRASVGRPVEKKDREAAKPVQLPCLIKSRRSQWNSGDRQWGRAPRIGLESSWCRPNSSQKHRISTANGGARSTKQLQLFCLLYLVK